MTNMMTVSERNAVTAAQADYDSAIKNGENEDSAMEIAFLTAYRRGFDNGAVLNKGSSENV